MQILQFYARIYVEAGYGMGIMGNAENISTGLPAGSSAVFTETLQKLRIECEKIELVCSMEMIDMLLYILKTQDLSSGRSLAACNWQNNLFELNRRLSAELSARVFFSLGSRQRRLYENSLEGWGEVLDRFPLATSDVEEMQKCFALSRYPSSVFHSTQVIEHGLIALGKFLKCKDYKSGWVATSRELKRIVDCGHDKRTDHERLHFLFIEQMNATVQALMNAWRHRISHAIGRLSVLPGDFSPAIAEDIISATRAFMRRLATEMPTTNEDI